MLQNDIKAFTKFRQIAEQPCYSAERKIILKDMENNRRRDFVLCYKNIMFVTHNNLDI